MLGVDGAHSVLAFREWNAKDCNLMMEVRKLRGWKREQEEPKYFS